MSVFLDTSVLLAGLIDFGPQSAPAQSLLHAVAEKRTSEPATAWHCCLEFFSVATRLPPEFRVAPADAMQLLQDEVFARMAVHDLPSTARLPMLQAAARDGVGGGRIYDAHIAEVARAAGAAVVVTDNRRHFLSALRYGIRVETPAEFLAGTEGERHAAAVSDEHLVTCPYCGETVEIYIEPDVKGSFVQDCEVCCNPWRVRVSGRGENRDVSITRADGSE